jgi:hypothetical protein
MSSAAASILQYVTAALSFLAIFKLWRTHLYQRYKALFAFLILFLSYSLGTNLFSNYRSPGYRLYWEITQPLTWLLSVLVVLELYSLILEPYKGLATFGRWIQYAGFTLATIVSLLVMLPGIQARPKRGNAVILYYYPIERGVDFGMLVFLLFLLVWLTQYPVPLSRNVVVHSVVYTALFFSNSFGMFLAIFFNYQLSVTVSLFLSGVLGLCLLAWLVFLTPKGEEIRVRIPRFSALHEARVLDQLDALNRTLLHISRK